MNALLYLLCVIFALACLEKSFGSGQKLIFLIKLLCYSGYLFNQAFDFFAQLRTLEIELVLQVFNIFSKFIVLRW